MITACDHLFDEYEDKRRTVLYGEVINREAFDLPLSGVSFCEKAKRVHDRIASEGTGFLDEKYPVLKRLGETLETDLARAEEELLQRIREDAAEISNTFLDGRPIRKLISVSVGGADSHNHSRMTAVIHSDAGSFVYKPHSLLSDRMIRDLASRVLPGAVRLPRSIDKGSYGYTEFIAHEAPAGETQAVAFYRNLGVFTAFVRALGITDLHCENFLVSDTYPVLIDMETVMRGDLNSTLVRESDFRAQFRHSVASCCLLPQRISGVEFSILFSTEENNRCAPTVDGEKVTVLPYESHYFDGFRDGYGQILRKRDLLIDAMRQYTAVPIRIVIRNSSVYSRLLQQLTKPGNLRTEEDFAKAGHIIRAALDKQLCLFPPLRTAAFREDELRAMSRGDIPYYYTDHDSTALKMIDGEPIRDALRLSPVDTAFLRIRSMGPEDLAFQQSLIRRSFADRVLPIRFPPVPVPSPEIPPTLPLSESRVTAIAEKLLFEILDRVTVCPGGMTGWVVSPVSGDVQAMMQFEFAEGSLGIAVFLGCMLKTDAGLSREKQSRIRKVIDDILNDGESIVNDLLPESKIRSRSDPSSEPDGVNGILKGCTLIRDLGVTELPLPLLSLCREGTPLPKKRPSQPRGVWEPLRETDVLTGGNAGDIHDLIDTGDLPGAETLIGRMLKRAETENGFRFLDRFHAPAFRLSFMSGAAGIGYTLLRYLHPELLGDPR